MPGSRENAQLTSSLKDELIARGYDYQEFKLAGETFRRFTAPNSWRWVTRKGFYDYPFVAPAVKLISKDKRLSSAFAELHAVPTPPTLATRDMNAAREFLQLHGRVIVKPADRSGGQGLTVGVTNETQLEQAIATATFDDIDPLIQRQLDGQEVRFTVLGGKVRSAILRQNPQLVGDGTNSLIKLLELENSERTTLVFPTLSYPQLAEELLDRVGLDKAYIPADGEVIDLGRSSMIRGGASFIGVTDSIHKGYCQVAELLASELNAPLLVVDLLINDTTVAPDDSNYAFLEFNTSPSSRVYSSLRGGDMPDIMGMIADMIDDYAQRSKATDTIDILT